MIDCANGAAYKVAPGALWELGADVVSIGVDPDGFNINKECGSTDLTAITHKVREMRADIGIALDGDADRVMIVDERGHVVDGDQLLAVIAESWKEDGRLTAARRGRHRDVQSRARAPSRRSRHRTGPHAGRRPLRARAHARARLQCRRRTVRPHYPLRLHHHRRRLRRRLAGAGRGQARNKPVSEVCHRFEPLPQVLKNVRYQKGKPLENASVRSAIASAEKKLGRGGRLIVRPSGTEPVIRVMAEGDDKVAGRGGCGRRGRGADRSRGLSR